MFSIYFRLQPRTEHRGWRVVGNCENLGFWDPKFGFELNVHQQSFWTSANPVTITSISLLEYKYVYCERDFYQWESLPFNRTLQPAFSLMIVDDIEGDPLSKTHLPSFKNYPIHRDPYYFPEPTSSDSSQVQAATKVIIAAWAAPLEAVKGEKGWEVCSTGGDWVRHLYEGLQNTGADFVWICAGGRAEDEARSVLRQHRVVRVPIPPDLHLRHQRFAGAVLSPVFHSLMSPLLDFATNLSELWDGYRSANVLFADAIMDVYTGCESIWLNDLDLLLTPSFLTRRTRDPINLGLMLHHPFPSSEIFKLLPHRAVLLNSILCCDLVGFQTFRFAKHFLSTCNRMMEAGGMWREDGAVGVDYCGRFVMVEIGFLGVSLGLVAAATSTPSYRASFARLSERFSHKSVLTSLDPMHPASGLLQKIEIFKSFLLTQPSSDRDKFTLYQLCSASPGNEAYKSSVVSAVDRVNSELGTSAIELDLSGVEGVPLDTRLAAFAVAKVYFNSSIRSGVSISLLEFILAHSETPSLMVISEFSSFAKVLKSPVAVNPFDTDGAREELLYMDGARQGFGQDLETARTQTAERFCERFLGSLRKARKNERDFVYATYGLGASLKYVALSKNFSTLFESSILMAYRHSRNRLLFFDNEGTLSDIRRFADFHSNLPSASVLESLEDLCRDERNSVYVTTGRGKQALDEVYAIPGLGLIAEYGSFIRDRFTFYQWERTVLHRLEWLAPAADIIATYVPRVEGSSMELKETSVKFSYSDADKDYGSWQSQELISHLNLVMQPYQDQCEVVSGSDYVEVKSWGVSKGSTLSKIAKMMEARKGDVDFILAIGDGISDEEMFRELRRFPAHPSIFSCVVGMKPTAAQYYVVGRSEVVRLLEMLRNISLKVRNRQTRGNVSQSDIKLGGVRTRGRSFANDWGDEDGGLGSFSE